MKYTLIAEDEYSGSKTTREFNVDYLPEVLSEVELFLRGAGFLFAGNLNFVDHTETCVESDYELEENWEDEFYTIQESELYDSKEAPVTKSSYYFDSERNK